MGSGRDAWERKALCYALLALGNCVIAFHDAWEVCYMIRSFNLMLEVRAGTI